MPLENIVPHVNAAQTITTAVAPAILVSAAGLMLLGLQNKFSNITDRIRNLDRMIVDLEEAGALTDIQVLRIANAEAQVDVLLLRAKLVRDAVFLLYVAVVCLISATLVAALDELLKTNLGALTFGLFVVAVVAMFTSAIQSIREVLRSFKVVKSEVAMARDISPLRENPK